MPLKMYKTLVGTNHDHHLKLSQYIDSDFDTIVWSKLSIEFEIEIFKMEDQEEVDVAAMFDLTQKKKKKKSKKATSAEADGAADAQGQDKVGILKDEDGPPTYSYNLLLTRVFDFLQQNNMGLLEKTRYTLKPPQLMKVGTKKTLWVNYQEICKMMKRNPDHVFQFMMAELGTEGSIDGSQRLVIKGKFVPQYIESLLKKYIKEYVICQMCKSFNTSLTRDSVSRLFFVQCQDCGSSRSVAPIRAGFHATTKADRRAQRNA